MKYMKYCEAVTREEMQQVLRLIRGGETTAIDLADRLNRSEQWIWLAIEKLEREGFVRSRVQHRVLLVSAE